MQRLQPSAKAKGECHESVPNSMLHNFPHIVYGLGTPSSTCLFERIGLSSTVSKHTLCKAAELHTGAEKLPLSATLATQEPPTHSARLRAVPYPRPDLHSRCTDDTALT